GAQDRVAQVDRAPRRVETAERVQPRDELQPREPAAVQRNRPPAPEPDDGGPRRPRRFRKGPARVELLRRQLPRIVRLASPDPRPPEPLVDRVARRLWRNRDPKGLAEGGLVLARDPGVPDRREDLDSGGEDPQPRVEAELVVAGGGRAVGDGPGSDPLGVARDVLDLHGALGRDRERIGPAAQDVAEEERQRVALEDFVAAVKDGMLLHAGGLRARGDRP